MNEQSQPRFYVVHDEQGRILAIAPVALQQVSERVRLGCRPLPGPGQKVVELVLDHEHASLRPHELLEFEVALHPQTGNPQLRRRKNV
jgi:hypothetical protein